MGKDDGQLDPVKPETLEQIHSHPAIQADGAKYDDDLLVEYSKADCFVFPSYREGFPNTVMEAGAMNIPCVVTDINGSREIIENDKNGLIIPSKDADALYKAMKEMIEDSNLRNNMVKNAREMIATRFDKKFVQQSLMDFYEEVFRDKFK